MRTTAIVGLCAVLAAAGFFLGRFTKVESMRVDSVSTSDAGTAAALQEVRGELAALKQTLAALQLQPSLRSSVDATTDSDLNGLVEQLRQLVARSPDDVGGVRDVAPTALKSASAVGYASREELESSIVRLRNQLQRCSEETLADEAELARKSFAGNHAAWTVRDLLSRYGQPSRIEAAGHGVSLRYDLPTSAGFPGYARFWIIEGFVIESELELDI